ncbi:metallophosphoesterase [Lentilactobacillus kisonensis]|uniref:Putative phosphoesterase n=1 Tax=Lentilactobacillus kisonensis F0435 TaxID=797516 RepID=H1LGW4_9LACO|nr:metallophosphoesterase [Lentilactobacillus kisonensis]EHO50744.1 putative phosphoesterase [Lentilactobacillus kisonensis F0435]
MLKIAASSDNHLDINKVDVNQVIDQQARYLIDQQVDYYLIAGDLFNDFNKALEYVQNLQEKAVNTNVLFIAGNHDMIRNVTYEQLEMGNWPGYINNRFVDLPNTNIRIIGINGWYDYSFAINVDKPESAFYHWKKTFWIDSQIKQPMSDIEREDIVIAELEKQLIAAQKLAKRVIVVTHFVPNRKFIRYTNDFRFWNMANAMMGSVRLSTLIEKYAVNSVVFGHIHNRYDPVKIGQTWYYNGAVGYHNHHHNEWQSTDFMTEWRHQLKFIQII